MSGRAVCVWAKDQMAYIYKKTKKNVPSKVLIPLNDGFDTADTIEPFELHAFKGEKILLQMHECDADVIPIKAKRSPLRKSQAVA